jgi:hypothetical protein
MNFFDTKKWYFLRKENKNLKLMNPAVIVININLKHRLK